MSDKYFIVFCADFMVPEPHRSFNTDRIVSEIHELNPKAIVTVSGYEVGIQSIFKTFIEKIKPWCLQTGKKFIIFSPAKPFYFKEENSTFIEWIEFHGYDTVNFDKIVNHYRDNKPILTNPTKLYTCYNNRPDIHRTYTVDQLARFDLLNDGIVTYRHLTEVLPEQDPTFDLSEHFMYYEGSPALVDEPDFVLHQGYIPNDLPRNYLNGLIDIVTESRIQPREWFLSEKLNKPLMTQKPFLVVSCQYYHRWLKEYYGIEPYTELFDYRFDEFEKMEHRVVGIVKNLKRISQEYKTPEDYKNLIKILKPKLEHNLSTYLKLIAQGDKLLENIPSWMIEDQHVLYEKYLIKGEAHYQHEFCNLNCFFYGVIKAYREGKFRLPDISR